MKEEKKPKAEMDADIFTSMRESLEKLNESLETLKAEIKKRKQL